MESDIKKDWWHYGYMREIFSKLLRASRPDSLVDGKASKRGFGLIELLIVMLILSVLAGLIVIGVGNVFAKAGDSAYMVGIV
jgi:prepilin-type N-terminal cleavage/methylation domain-containing protein